MIVDTGTCRAAWCRICRARRAPGNFAQSLVDVTEAYDLGMSAHMRSADPAFTGQVVGIRRNPEAAAEAATRPSCSPFPQASSPISSNASPPSDPAELPGHYAGSGRVLPAAHRRRAETRHEGRHPRHHRAVQQALTKLPAPPSQHAEGSTNASRPALATAVVARNVRFSLKSARFGRQRFVASPAAQVDAADDRGNHGRGRLRHENAHVAEAERARAKTPGRSARRTRR